MKKINNFSISKSLREENKSNDYFELLVSANTLEDLIALKLELAYKSLGFPIYGIPIWKKTSYVVKEGILKFALSVSSNQKEIKKILGLNNLDTFKILKDFSLLEDKKNNG